MTHTNSISTFFVKNQLFALLVVSMLGFSAPNFCAAQSNDQAADGAQVQIEADTAQVATSQKQSIAKSFLQTLQTKGSKAAAAWFEQAKANAQYHVDESELLAVGRDLLQSGHIKDAIGVFEANASAHPDSAEAYDCLGEAYWKHGEKKVAAKHYTKAVELNPSNSNAIRVLDILRG